MDFAVMALLSFLGLAMGVATLAGLVPRGFELPLWLMIAVVAAIWIARRVERRVFLNGLLAGILAGLASPLVQVLFFDTYLRNNPDAVEAFQTLPAGLSPRTVVAVMGPVVALIYGLCLGLFAWVAGKALRRKPAPV